MIFYSENQRRIAMRRISKTMFPGKFARKGSLRYIAVPSSVEERMGLKDGDYLDVEISWPITEEYNLDEEPLGMTNDEGRNMKTKGEPSENNE